MSLMPARLSAVLFLVGCGNLGLESALPTDATGEVPEDTDARSPYGDPVDEDTADTDTTTDTDTPEDTGTPDDTGTGPVDTDDTDSEPPPPSAPRVLAVNATAGTDAVVVDVHLEDDDGDLVGGTLQVLIGDDVLTLSIPGDLDSFSGGHATIEHPVGPCSGGLALDIEAAATDAVGLASNVGTASYTVPGVGFSPADGGDAAVTAAVLGSLTPDVDICGSLSSTGSTPAGGYSGDIDWMEITAGASGAWTFDLDWTASAGDYDLHLLDKATGNTLASAVEMGPTRPESVTWNVVSGRTYYLAVAGWAGGTGAWTVRIR